MNRTYVKDVVPAMDKQKVLLKGWVHDVRDLANIKFLLLRDKTGIIQVVAPKDDVDPKTFETLGKLSPESVVTLEGVVVASKQAKKGVEVLAISFNVLAVAQALPITVTEKGITTDLSKRLDYRSIDLRKPKNLAIFHVQSALVSGMVDYLDSDGFTRVYTPCIMGAASESGSEVFQIKYYDKTAFLRQDPQLHRQLTIAGGIERLYDIGPSWRAEKSHTTKHLCEHRACAVEFAFIEDEKDTMRVEEKLVVSAMKKVKEQCKAELELLDIKIQIPETPFPELEFPKIWDILEKGGWQLKHGDDLDTEAEKILWEHVKKKYTNEFYFFNKFPFQHKPFYVMRNDDEPEFARSVDLNYKGMELSSGGQREHRYDRIMEQVKEKKVNPKSVEWFTKFFKYGVPPHGGFAIGVERLTQNVLNMTNIKECVLFPRDPERLEP